MFVFLKRLFSPKLTVSSRQRIQIVERELASLTLSDWQQDAALCAQSRNVLSSPIVRQMLGVLYNSHPAFQVITGDFQARALQQARCEGYTLALADFESMGHFIQPFNPVIAEFRDEFVTDDEAKEYGASGNKTA
jgi:hypothetical protein